MRKLMAAIWLSVLATVPAVATGWDDELDRAATRWAAPAPRSDWREDAGDDEAGALQADPIRAFTYAGAGWSRLDGWMKGDPLLRQWVVHRFDLDADGVLSIDEAAMARRAFYDLADANRSGIITSAEFLSGWGTVRAALLGPYALAG